MPTTFLPVGAVVHPQRVTQDRSWLIEQEGFDPVREPEFETIFALGNGYSGVRGALLTKIASSTPELFLAGVYAKKTIVFPYAMTQEVVNAGVDDAFAQLVPFPSPLQVSIKSPSCWLTPNEAELQSLDRVLDLHRATLHQTLVYKSNQGQLTALLSSSCASLAEQHIFMQDLTIVRENHETPLVLELNGPTEDFALRYPHLRRGSSTALATTPFATFDLFETAGSQFHVALASRLLLNGEEISTPNIELPVSAGRTMRIRRMIAVYTSRDCPDPATQVAEYLTHQTWGDLDGLWKNHAEAWQAYWEKADICFLGAPDVTQAQRFNLYQLRLGKGCDDRVSIGARALTGRSYEGHVFWDADTYAMPVFLCSQPQIAKSFLMYRFHTLGGARRRASTMGHPGACFAWESSVTGDDVTPRQIVIKSSGEVIPVLTGEQQLHVTADVAFAVRQYFHATGDIEFLQAYGAEILVETARFWASRANFRDQGYHIDGVIGPDEYHFGINDDAYTNWLVRENLAAAIDALAVMKATAPESLDKLHHSLNLTRPEVDRWDEVKTRLFIPRPNAQGVIEQFAGFFDLPQMPPIEPDQTTRPPLLNWLGVNSVRRCKQPDVLMIPFLIPSAFDPGTLRANFAYYEPITDHGSSLSRPVHAAIAARLGLAEKAREYWSTSLRIDLENLMGNTALGFHVGCAGGAWQALIFHFLGITLGNDGPTLDLQRPRTLPCSCQAVQLKIFCQNKTWTFNISNLSGDYRGE